MKHSVKKQEPRKNEEKKEDNFVLLRTNICLSSLFKIEYPCLKLVLDYLQLRKLGLVLRILPIKKIKSKMENM
jgi:hypothetical protein